MNPSESLIGVADVAGRPVSKLPEAMTLVAAGIIFNELGEVLLQKRADIGFWGLPAGRTEIGESVAQAAVREVFEETALNVSVKRLMGIYSDPKQYSLFDSPAGIVTQVISFVFECEASSGELRISGESTDIGYFPTNALPEDTMIGTRMRVEDAVAKRVEPFIR